MRLVLCGLAAWVVASHAAPAAAQQGTVQISGAAQAVTGNAERTASDHPIEPDFGITWLQPGVRFGTFQMELREARRGDRLHLGRNYAALRDVKHGAVSWTFEAGDAYFTRALGEYGFANLTTPPVTLSGGVISALGTRGSLHIVGGRATAWRNIFGSDPDTMAQTLGMVRGVYKAGPRVDILGRISRIQTSSLREFAFNIADGKQAGGGVRVAVSPSIQVIGDGSYVQYRRLDSNTQHHDGSFLVGTSLLLPHGWVQLNVSRFSPGEFPALNDSLHDRETLFGAGEYDLGSRFRLFGGADAVRTNIDPEQTLPASAELARNTATRAFAGLSVRLGDHGTVVTRIEDGYGISRFERIERTRLRNDSGSRTVEWQSTFDKVSAYVRASSRANVDSRGVEASFSQSELGTQLFYRISPASQLFGTATVTRHETGNAQGSDYWQLGGGANLKVPRQNLWIRGEGTFSRNVDLLTREFVPREAFNFGMNGQAGRGMTFYLNIAADRTPLLTSTGTPWTTRSTIRIVQNFSTGTARAVPGGVLTGGVVSRARGTGQVIGTVFADWNANGTQDPDEAPIENIPVRIPSVTTVTTRRDGEFSFVNVPVGPQQVGLDTSALPLDFDPPAASMIDIELDRNTTRRVSFGLIPLGTVRGRVVRDANANGKVDPGEEPIEGAVLTLDNGSRSEEVRRGTYRFDSIRSGDHVVSIIRESLPEGAVITGASQVPLALKRDQLTVEVDFAVVIQKRPETRKVFPSRGGVPPPSPPPSTAARPANTATPGAAPRPANGGPTATPRLSPAQPGRDVPARSVTPPALGPGPLTFAVQIAALHDPLRAEAIVDELTTAGYPAYLLTPGAEDPNGPYRVRVGGYRSREAAAGAAGTLERQRGEKLWVIREQGTR